MPFIRAKQHKKGPRAAEDAERWGRDPVRTYYYLVETYREGGKVRQRTLAYLGKYPTVEEALTRLPVDIERRKNDVLPKLCRWRDEAQAAYQELIARAEKPLVIKEGSNIPWQLQERWHREFQARLRDKLIPAAERKYLAEERSVRFMQDWILEMENRLAKLQSLLTPSRSAQRKAGGETSVGTTV
jgi:hypothetical protein